jgi:ElaB/YqjD/DUF883 family membrane-anchored ribosome-binding protein
MNPTRDDVKRLDYDDTRELERVIARDRAEMRNTLHNLKSAVQSNVQSVKSTYAPKAMARRYLTPQRAKMIGRRALDFIRSRPKVSAAVGLGIVAVALLSRRRNARLEHRRLGALGEGLAYRETVYREPVDIETVYGRLR